MQTQTVVTAYFSSQYLPVFTCAPHSNQTAPRLNQEVLPAVRGRQSLPVGSARSETGINLRQAAGGPDGSGITATGGPTLGCTVPE